MSSDVVDVVLLEPRGVGLDALRAARASLPALAGEAAGRVEVEHSHGLVAHVPEPVDDVRRGEDVRAGYPVHDLVADVELDLAVEDEKRVGVPLVQVRIDAASRVERDLEERELRPVRLDALTLAGTQRDRTLRDRLAPADSPLRQGAPGVGADG